MAHSNKKSFGIREEYPGRTEYQLPYQLITQQKEYKEAKDIIKQKKADAQDFMQKLLRCDLIFADEVSCYSYADIQRLIQFGKRHHIQIIFAGDIGYQCSPCVKKGSPMPIAERLKLFDYRFDFGTYIYEKTGVRNFRFMHDDHHAASVTHVRNMMKRNATFEEIAAYLVTRYKRITTDEMYADVRVEDIILAATHEVKDMHTDKIKRLIDKGEMKNHKDLDWYIRKYDPSIANNNIYDEEDYVDNDDFQEWMKTQPASSCYDRKYRFNKTKVLNNTEYYTGSVIITDEVPEYVQKIQKKQASESKKPKSKKSKKKPDIVEQYAFTTHSYQGETISNSDTKLYIELSGMIKAFGDKEATRVLYTSLSRAKYRQQVVFVGEIDKAQKKTKKKKKKNPYHEAKIYKITSKQTDKIYIGSTKEEDVGVRLLAHKNNYNQWMANPAAHKHIRSYDILKFGDAEIKVMEYYPCNSDKELKLREGQLIYEHRFSVVNAQIPGPYTVNVDI